MKHLVLVCACALALLACGKNSGNGGDDDDDATADAGPDGPLTPVTCTTPDPSKPQCSNCIDDDGDGFIDGYDIHCSGPLDDDESSFGTGIPGDNVDPVNQDCFFDGNSGAGNDGCNVHVCCLLGATTVAECPIGANRYDPDECPPPLGTRPLSQQCIDTCGALTPPGCDCFGCCTLCNPNNPSECYDVLTNPVTSPDCTADTLSDPTKCTRCDQVAVCGDAECGGSTCILCPGQDSGDLPAECNNTPACPVGSTSCTTDAECGASSYCSTSQCCVGVIL